MPSLRDKLNRRSFLCAGTVAGLGLAEFFRLQAAQGVDVARRRDVNCIFIITLGGMPHQDMWDYKADAPVAMRDGFRAIQTAVPGIVLSDVLPHPARVTGKLAILRSMTHGDSDHGRGYHTM